MKTKRWFFTKLAFVLCVVCTFSVVKAQTISYEQKAKRILDTTGVKGGLIVHIGCGGGRLTPHLLGVSLSSIGAVHTNDSYSVHGLDVDPENVQEAREHIRSLGLYGKVSVDHWKGKSLP